MWLTVALLSKNIKDPAKKFNNYRYVYPYRQLLPQALKDTVSTKGYNQKTAACLQEMSVMLVCFKKHDFDQSRCAKEIESFMMCNKQFAAAGTTASATTGRLPREQVVKQLRSYPNKT